MALSQTQWFDKIKTYVPSWLVSRISGETPVAQGLVYALAKLASEAQLQIETNRDATFITRASGTDLDMLGDERSIARLSGETDLVYSARVRTFATALTDAGIATVVNSAIASAIGTVDGGLSASQKSTVYDLKNYGPYLSSGPTYAQDIFINCTDVIADGTRSYNFLYIYIPYLGMAPGITASFYTSLIATIEANKASGVSYDVLSCATDSTQTVYNWG